MSPRQAQAVSLYRANVALADACTQMQISKQAFYMLLQAAGEPRNRRRGPKIVNSKRKIASEHAARILSERDSGRSIEAIASDLGVYRACVVQVLQEHGIDTWPRRITDETRRIWATLYLKKRLSTPEIAKRYNVSQTTVHNHLRDLGIVREIGEATRIAKQKRSHKRKTIRRRGSTDG